MTVRVLFVSTGGVCRAPLAVAVLRYIVTRAGMLDRFEIDGAGTYPGHAGRPPTMLAIEVAEARGYAMAGLQARLVQARDIAHFDQVLAMDGTQLAAMRFMAPGGLMDRPQMLMRFAPEVGVRDVADPFGGTREDFERALDLIEAGCAGLLKHLFVPPARRAT